MLRICRKASLKLNKYKCLFRCTSIPFFREILLWYVVSPYPRKVQALMNIPLSKSNKELQPFLGILNYLSKFLPVTAEVCEPWWKLSQVKAEWSWHGMYQDLYDKANKIVKQDACMKFMMHPNPCTWKWMNLVLVLGLNCCR